MMDDHIELRVINRGEGNWKSLLDCWIHFWSEEIFSTAIPGLVSDNGKKNFEELLEVVYETITAPLVVAWDVKCDKVAGFCMNQIQRRDTKKKRGTTFLEKMMDKHWENITKEEFEAYARFWNASFDVDLLQKYQVDEAFYPQVLSVSKDYARKGLATRMVKKSLEIAKDLGLSLAIGSFSSSYSQSIATRCGFEVELELIHEDTYELYAAMPQEITNRHKKSLYMAKKLQGYS